MNYCIAPEISPNTRKSFQCQSRSTTNVMKLQKKLCDMTFFHGHRLLKNGKQNKPIPAPMGARSSVNAFCAGVSPDCPESAILECGGLSSRIFEIFPNHYIHRFLPFLHPGYAFYWPLLLLIAATPWTNFRSPNLCSCCLCESW